MLRITSILFAAVLLISCQNDEKKATAATGTTVDSTQFTTVEWLDSTRDFGKIQEGQLLEVSFRFRNTGSKPLLIAKVQPSCGCTVAETPTQAIASGSEGQIKATFNSKGRSGINHKTLNVFANMKNSPHPLQFVVEVEKKAS
ncbi:MAG TPA: DUF1573 domain-containing protein [Puia sp.]|nr:DUF1573 domain-containing protein [Puia sp.]